MRMALRALAYRNALIPLTTNIETLPAAGVTAAANAVFTAPAGVTPQGVQANTLQSGDVLNGSGQQNVLNATFVTNAATAPTINNIPTVNVTSLVGEGSANLNLGTSTGVTAIGDINSTGNVNITGVRTALSSLTKTGGIARNTTITSQSAVLNGLNNSLQINLSGVDGGNINVTPVAPSSTNGYETFNVSVAAPSTIGRLIAGPSLENITVSGSALEIEGESGVPVAVGTVAFNALEESLQSFNASAMNGPLVVGNIENGVSATEGASVVNAAAEDLTFVGSNNGTTLFVEAASLAQGDVLNGGAGAGGTLVLTGASSRVTENGLVQGNNSAFAATGFETLAITDTRGNGVSARPANSPVAFNLANVSGVNTVQLGTASSAVVGLTNLQYTSPLAINVTGTGESNVNTGNGVNAVFFGAFGDSDTVNYTFGNRGRALNSNVSTLTLGQLSLPNIENINLTFNDLSSNTSLAYAPFAGAPVTSLFNAAQTAVVRFVTVNSQSGETDRTVGGQGAINLGDIGNASVRGVDINSNASVSATFSNRAGASLEVGGAGDHNIQVVNAAGDSIINGGSATGDIRLAVSVVANTGRALFTGGTGDDILIGGAGADVLTGNTGDDELTGNLAVDVLSGGDNNDVLNGGDQQDVLTGGFGSDDFVIGQGVAFAGGVADLNASRAITNGASAAAPAGAPANGTFENITDFSVAQGDTVNFALGGVQQYDFNIAAAGVNGIVGTPVLNAPLNANSYGVYNGDNVAVALLGFGANDTVIVTDTDGNVNTFEGAIGLNGVIALPLFSSGQIITL
jgi:hypothetical protein